MKEYHCHACKKNCIIQVKNKFSIFECSVIRNKEDWLPNSKRNIQKKLL